MVYAQAVEHRRAAEGARVQATKQAISAGLASTELFAGESKQCGKCGMQTDESHGCCHDEVKIVKMDGDQNITASISFNLPVIEALVHHVSDFMVASFYNVPGARRYQNHPPPLISAQDTYLQNGVFRI